MLWKYCFVLSCLNNSKKNPEKHYFRVPYNKELREKWCKAVDRPVSSLKQSSTAYCCSDHFNIDEDVDSLKSTSTNLKLHKYVMPSKYSNSSSYSGEKMAEIDDIFGPDVLSERTTESQAEARYIREVVYIEENDNDQFLQENVEDTDCLSIDRIDEPENETAKAVVEISDDDNLLKAVATAIKSLKPTESFLKRTYEMSTDKNESNSNTNQKVDSSQPQMKFGEVATSKTQTAVKSETITSKTFKAVEGKVITSRPITKVVGKINASASTNEVGGPVPLPSKQQIPLQHKMVASIPQSKGKNVTVESRNLIENLKNQETCNVLVPIPLKFQKIKQNTVARWPSNITPSPRYVHPMVNSAKTKDSQQKPGDVEKTSLYQVNRAKYSNIKGDSKINNQQNELPIKRYKQSDGDDDCIILDGPAPKFIYSNSTINVEQNKLQLISTPKPNASSGLVIKKLPACISVKANAAPQIPKVQTTSSTSISRIVRVEPLQKIREFGKHLTKLQNKPDEELQLIKLILLENPSICKSSANKTIKIIRSKKNEFQIADNVYYYRTNNSFPKNYFFMNITRNLCQSHETVQRSYGIYWGSPRVSCVGIVETRGTLDDETKDFVFTQVKKSLFEQNGEQNLKFLNVIQKSVPKPATFLSKAKPAVIQSNMQPKNKERQPSIIDPEIINLDDDSDEIVPKTNTNPLVNFLTNVKIPPIGSSLLAQNTMRVSPNEILNNQIVQQSSPTDHDGQTTEVQITCKKDGLVQFYKRLVPSTRNLINKLKYFEMNNGAVYTVTVGPNFSVGPGNVNPFNIIFLKNNPADNIQPVSRSQSISKLVNDIFDVIQSTTDLGLTKKNDKLMILSDATKTPTPTVKVIPSSPVSEPLKLTTANIKIKSPSTTLKSPITTTTKPKSIVAVTIPVDKPNILTENAVSPKTSKCVVIDTNNSDKEFKYKCDVCAQGFDRSYKFRRHQFVEHNLDNVDGNHIPVDGVSNLVKESACKTVIAPVARNHIPTLEQISNFVKKTSGKKVKGIVAQNNLPSPEWLSSLVNKSTGKRVKRTTARKRTSTLKKSAGNKAKETVVRDHMPTPEQLFTSNVESELVIKKEKLDIPDDKCLPDDKTLLIPLFEMPMDEQSYKIEDYLNDFLPVEVKQEPEEHFEEVVVMPLSPVNYSSLQKTVRKRPKQLNPKSRRYSEKNTDSSTDSAMEQGSFNEEKVEKKRKLKYIRLPKVRVKKDCKAVENMKRRRQTKKRLKKKIKNVKIRKGGNNPKVPVKISKTKQLMYNLPKCYVKLTDITQQS